MLGSSSGKLNRFSDYISGVSYTLNPEFWLSSFDLTGVCVWNDWIHDVGLECHGGGVAVALSPGDRSSVIHAAHVGLPVGTIMKWLDSDGNLVTRTAVSVSTSGYDIQITTLDSPLPSNVAVYEIYRGGLNYTRGIRCDQYAKCYSVLLSPYDNGNLVVWSIDETYSTWSKLAESNDSGYPVLRLVNGVFQVVAETFGVGGGPRISAFY